MLFQNANDAIWMADVGDKGRPGPMLEVNDAACERFGYTREELLQLSPADIAVSDDERSLCEAMDRLRSTGHAVFDTKIRTKSGALVPCEVSAHAFLHEERPVVVSVVRDLSERVAAEAERRALEEQLRQSQKLEAIARLAGGVAHDFNNFLGIVRILAQAIQRQPEDVERVRAGAEEIEKAGQRASALTRKLLAFARSSASAPEVLDLDAVARDFVPMLEQLMGDGVALRLDLGAAPSRIRIERSGLEQIFANLVRQCSRRNASRRQHHGPHRRPSVRRARRHGSGHPRRVGRIDRRRPGRRNVPRHSRSDLRAVLHHEG